MLDLLGTLTPALNSDIPQCSKQQLVPFTANMASHSPALVPSSDTTPAAIARDLPPDHPDRVFLSIFVDIREIIALYDVRRIPQSNIGFERVPIFTFRCRDTLQHYVVHDVKKKITTYVWEHIHQNIRTSDFVLLFNPRLATRHRWTPGLLKLYIDMVRSSPPSRSTFEHFDHHIGDLYYLAVAMDPRPPHDVTTTTHPTRMCLRSLCVRKNDLACYLLHHMYRIWHRAKPRTLQLTPFSFVSIPKPPSDSSGKSS